MDNRTNLVKIYLFVCDMYEKELKYFVQRFSNNNNNPDFTDKEIMTIILYRIAYEKRRTIKEVYEFTSSLMLLWFPLLPSYYAFVIRENRLGTAFTRLLAMLTEDYAPADDSIPIITCSGKDVEKWLQRSLTGVIAPPNQSVTTGVKMHLMASHRAQKLPMSERLILTHA